MELSSLTAISPIDGRYAEKTAAMRTYFSESALIYYRVYIEIQWLHFLAQNAAISELQWHHMPDSLQAILDNWSVDEALAVKQWEKQTNHDIKACEYYLRDQLQHHPDMAHALTFIHFGCTSEDINNLAYALMLKHSMHDVILPELDKLITNLSKLAQQYAPIAMLARTHGQPATPTTLGKELANFHYRLARQRQRFQQIAFLGKINGATGNFNAHTVAYPEVDWPSLAEQFVQQLGLTYNPYTTQIEPHDYISELSHLKHQINTILLDCCQDIWGYIALGYFKQNAQETEVGSSTMPHKINPIDFENAEGNLGLANAMLDHFANKLPISRWQRDLSDSTVMRHVGSALALCYLAYQSINKGLSKIAPYEHRIREDLEQSWPVLTEAIQTVMRRYGDSTSYERLKQMTRQGHFDQQQYLQFIKELDLPTSMKSRLQTLTPNEYVGLAELLANKSHSTS